MHLQISNIRLTPSESEDKILSVIKTKYNIEITEYTILKRSLDARNKNDIHYNLRILIETDDVTASRLLELSDIEVYTSQPIPETIKRNFTESVIVIGAGPAGLFAALRLIESGAHVIVLERGKRVEERMEDIRILEAKGILNPDSNSLFGEGGAGTYSDGKLTTRINRPEILWFYKKLIENGAPQSAAYESKPHIGTDRLQEILKNIRKSITDSGSEIRFSERVTDIYISGGKVTGVETSAGNEFLSGSIILAAGHSARDVYYLLKAKGAALEKKGFAAGVRVEHPVEEINKIQYGKSQYLKYLPAAEYNIAHNNKTTDRGTYSFCMCPGGSVINSSSENGELCVNGMSMSARKNRFSNSAIVVTVKKEDMGDDPLSGIEFQRDIERKAYTAGGGNFKAPAQTVTSFIKKNADKEIRKTSYLNGVTPARLEEFLPAWITTEIRSALTFFENKMRGFISPQALFIGAETRTSSPVRVTRDETLQSVNIRGLYPAGEGAGYSGGIVSSAVDGIRCADAIIEQRRN
ncbi:MAG: hypothetical protein CVV49_09925 [Spirochaetae bacterium HGW-Spirochaetae-5]|nr:MAG: hypothetical protein CVV49_09925 [Spirochaetae bacterium HGW-Spirochaetae-5]